MDSPTQAASLQLVTNNWGTNGVPSTVSMYIYVPTKLATNPPILVLIHYCGGSAGGVFGEAYGGGIVSACDQYGFIMVVPQAVDNTYTNGRCWDAGSTSSLTRFGGGDSQAILNMVNYTINTYHANSNRVYVTGTSSGAMMTEVLLALYPDVFKAGAEFSGVPAGCWAANDPGGGWSGPCAGGQVIYTPPQWGNIVRGMFQGYTGPRPRVQLWHGTADTIISYNDQTEAIKQWTDVLGLSTNPTSTATVTILNITNQWVHQTWRDPCGNTVLDAWSELNGGHGTDANLNAKYVIPFFGLDKAGAVDPVPPCPAPVGLAATAVSSYQISLTWNALTNAATYDLKRSTTSGGPYTTIATGLGSTNYTDPIAVGMKYYYVVSAVAGGSESANSRETTYLPYPWKTQDIGSVGIMAGSGNYSNGVFTVSGSGADIQSAADAFRYVYVPATGSCTIIARVTAVQNTDPWSKAGIMIRESLNANAANVLMAVTPGNGVSWQYRSSTGGSTTYNNTTGLSAPYWVKLVRSGNTFTGYRSPNGLTWTQQGTITFTMASTVYIGLALTSHNSTTFCAAAVDNVTGPGWPVAAPPLAPSGLAATAVSSNQINLIWTGSANTTSYNIKRSASNGGPYTLLSSGVLTTNYNDTGLPQTNIFYYVISALNPSGESPNSAPASATTPAPNSPPNLAPIADRTIGVGVTLSISNVATDAEAPPQTLAFGLLTAPTNAVINSTNGILTWRPFVTQANTTNPFTVVVADNGTPSLSATQGFVVVVNTLARPQLSGETLNDGKLVLQLIGDSGPDYEVQTSTNLMDWSTAFITNSPALPIFWTNDTADEPLNFFRVVVGPPLP